MTGEQYICSKCLLNFPYATEEHEDLLLQFSDWCVIPSIYTLFRYHRHGQYRRLIYALKYQSKRELGIVLGEMLGRRIPVDAGIDLLLPLPLHEKRQKKRGYNQAHLIAQGIANVLGVPVEKEAVKRVKDNPSQTGLPRERRVQNVQGIFRVEDPGRLAGHHLLLIDDVVTTGVTLASLLKELQAIPDLRVSIACLSRARDL